MANKTKPTIYTKSDFFDTTECDCGKPVFRYHNTSKNMFTLKCPNTKYEFEPKTKKWVLSKKQPCATFGVYHGERPVFANIINKCIPVVIDTNSLEKRLKALFQFVFVSKYSSTIQEIDLLVKNKLKREPRKVYYYPSIGNLRVSHRETYADYRDRIFSEKIVDRSEKIVQPNYVVIPVNRTSKNLKYDFIEVSEKESVKSDGDDTESDREEDSDNDSARGDSDYSSEAGSLEQEESDFDNFDDPDEEDTENYDYDD